MPKYQLNCPRAAITPRVARDFVTTVLRALGLDALVDDAVLCTSELVANSCVHTEGQGVLLIVDTDGFRNAVRVTVYDESRTPPRHLQGYDPESGRGLWIVDTVSDGRWGTELLGASGKGVWFEVGEEQPSRPPKRRTGTLASVATSPL
ncbi:ATP-binding protein [Streptomyces ipomoeae]|uniref:ATP-binding protein n=1 Tax=Streptomyces ipomoeae TaxID=103232 RepID=UPI0029A4204A|nr:ATP-binding protein [Streptomyces ipomoeae]MDX2824994.1 ATP-binding protein [Streptomyces ipomoeae]MDX2880527.1 ATP-binding protein [Streptomyces ipomoeae]